MDHFARKRQKTGNAILREGDVANIKRLSKMGMDVRRIHGQYEEVAISTIRSILRGDTWDWVPAATNAGYKAPNSDPLVGLMGNSELEAQIAVEEQGLALYKQFNPDDAEGIKSVETRIAGLREQLKQ